MIGTQTGDILRDPTRLSESAMGNLVADAMLAAYPGCRGGADELRRPARRTSLSAPPTAGEQPGEITWGEVFAVLPFGNDTVIETLTGAQLRAGLLNGLSPACNTAGRDRPLPAGRGPDHRVPLQRHHAGDRHALGKAPEGGPLTPIGDADTVRIVTNDFMFTGGDGYTALAQGTDVLQQPATPLLDVFAECIAANSPVSPTVEGRIRKG